MCQVGHHQFDIFLFPGQFHLACTIQGRGNLFSYGAQSQERSLSPKHSRGSWNLICVTCYVCQPRNFPHKYHTSFNPKSSIIVFTKFMCFIMSRMLKFQHLALIRKSLDTPVLEDSVTKQLFGYPKCCHAKEWFICHCSGYCNTIPGRSVNSTPQGIHNSWELSMFHWTGIL